MQIVCKSLFIKGVQNVHNLQGHMPGATFVVPTELREQHEDAG